MQRSSRVSEEIKKLVAPLISEEIEDPRLPKFTTVTKVEVSRDLAYATIFVSSLAGSQEEDQVLTALESAKGFIRREIGRKIRLRQVPEVRFKYDDSSEIGEHMSRVIDQVLAEDEKKRRQSATDPDTEENK